MSTALRLKPRAYSEQCTGQKSMILRKAAFCFFICLAFSSCSPVALLNATMPSDGYEVHKDIAYGDNPRQKLDIYVPKAVNPEQPAPVIVFFYGGSWQYGSKNEYLFVGQALASKGFVAVIADYRIYPEAYFPAFVEDGANAFAWVKDHIGQYGGRSDALFLAGHSAGAYIAVMLTVNPTYLAKAGVPPEGVRGTIGIAGPYDFLPLLDDNLKALFSKARPEDTQPINFVYGRHAPMFLATGDEDDTVIPRNTVRLSAKLDAFASPHETKIYKGVAHTGIILSLARGFRAKTTLLEDIAAFVPKNLQDRSPTNTSTPAAKQ